jgi:TPR repeat protein
MRIRSWLLPCAIVLLGLAPPASADFDAGLAAAGAGDYATALREWRPLAEQGHRDAQFNLGLLYENGLGVARDGATAASWYRRAAEQGDREAAAYLGEMYGEGLGVARNDAEALRWYVQAAEGGHPASQYNVGLFYALGRGAAPNDVEALAWLTVAVENGARDNGMLEALRKNVSRESLARADELAAQIRQRCKLP